MNEMELRTTLYEKLDKEYNNFIEEIMKGTPEEIINHSYEKVMKEELVAMFYPENLSFDISDIKALNKCKEPLEELYQGWMSSDSGIHEPLQDSVDDTIEFLKEEQQKNKNKAKER